MSVKKTFLLADAASHVEDFMQSLDVSFTECECCGKKHYNNFTDFIQYQGMAGTVEKLRNWEARYRVGKENVSQQP